MGYQIGISWDKKGCFPGVCVSGLADWHKQRKLDTFSLQWEGIIVKWLKAAKLTP
jgi:hypothetical protein